MPAKRFRDGPGFRRRAGTPPLIQAPPDAPGDTGNHKIDPATGDMLFFAAVGPVITWYRDPTR